MTERFRFPEPTPDQEPTRDVERRGEDQPRTRAVDPATQRYAGRLGVTGAQDAERAEQKAKVARAAGRAAVRPRER